MCSWSTIQTTNVYLFHVKPLTRQVYYTLISYYILTLLSVITFVSFLFSLTSNIVSHSARIMEVWVHDLHL